MRTLDAFGYQTVIPLDLFRCRCSPRPVGGHAAALHRRTSTCLTPRFGMRCNPSVNAWAVGPSTTIPVPRLLRAYLALGARICGEPAIDREFSTVDFLTWMDLETPGSPLLRKLLG